jgi:hypothetical protein
MNELQEYTASIPDSDPNKAELIRQWKIENKWGQQEVEEVVETPVEEVKTNGAAETDAAVVPTPEASESLDSGDLGSSTASKDEYPINLPSIQGLSTKTGGFGTSEFYDEVFNNIALNKYEEKKEQYEKELKKNNKIKKSQEKGIDLLESGEVNFASRVIIPRGEFGYDEYTIAQVDESIKNKEKGFENVVDVQDYVSKVPGAEIITYTENMDFEGAYGTLDEIDIQKYNPSELNKVMQNSVWAEDPNNQQTLNNNLNKLGEDYFFTAEIEKDADKNRDDGSKAINIQNTQAYRTSYLGNQASIEYPGITVDSILESGKSFLTEKELEFTKLSIEEQNKIAEKENYGEALFFGDNLINLDLDNVPEAQLELFEKSNELAATTEVDVLKDNLSKDYFKLVGLAKEIYNWDLNSSGAGNDPLYFTEKFANKKGFEWTNDIRRTVKEIATTGKLPKDLSDLDVRFMSDSDGHPLIKAFNNVLNDYKTVNRAILLNRDPLTTEQDGFFSSFAKGTGKMLGLDSDTNFEKQEDFLRWSQANGFTASKSAVDNDLFVKLPNNTFGLEQSFAGEFGAGTPELLKWMGEIYLFTRGSGNVVGKSQKWLNKAAEGSKRLAKIPYALPAFKGATSVLAQSANFTGGTLVSQYAGGEFDLQELQSSAGFGASLATGHVAYDPFVAYLRKSKFGKFFSPAVDRLTKYAPNTYNRVSRSIGGGFTGATTYQLGGVISQGGLRDSEGNITVSLRTQALETVKMITAGVFTKAIPNFQTIKKEFKSDIINARNSGRLDLESKNSAAALGLDKDSVTDVNENSLDNLNNAFNKKVDNLLKRKRNGDITKEQADIEFKELKNNYRVIDTQIAVNAAYKMIKAEEASGNAPKQSEFYTVSGKIKSGEKLNERDGEVLSYYGLDGVGMLYKRLGIQKNSANDQYLQSLIMNESLIDAQLNGKSFILTPYGLQPINPTEFVTPKGSKARANTREFLRKRLELDIQISRLKSLDTKNLSESELLRHKDSIAKKQEELKEYVEGGKLYDNTQSEIQGAAITAYEKDLKQVDPSKGQVIEESTPDSFQKRYDESGFAKKDVKQTIAFTDKEGNKVINREFALEVRDFTPLTHEIPHSILKDSFKDAEGNVTAEGIEMIDGVLSKLTPVQTKTLKQELASRYNIDPESKELWYEENITVLAELMKRGEITFTKSLGEGLAGLVPAFKKLLPNIEVDAETGKGIFEMLKAQDLSRVNITETETKDKSETKAAKLSKAKESETVLQAIDNLIPSNLKTKIEFDKWAQSEKGGKIIADALQPGGAMNNYIRSRGTREESDKMLDDVLFRVYNFNPEAKRKDGSPVGPEAFGEKIFADTAWAKVTARTKLFEEGEKKKLEKRQDDSTLQLIDESTSPSKKAGDKLAKKPSETIKYKSEALENLGITKKEGETDKDAIEKKISEVITKAYEGKDITRFKQTANIPEAVAKLYADMFGITTAAGIKALRVKAQNIPKGDSSGITRARQFLIDNAAADFARIPRTKDDFVKAGRAGGTGVYQTKLGKALYSENGKLTGSLKDYIDIISGKNVTVNGIEFNALVKGKKLPIYRDAQHIKAALDFHIRNRVLETLEPVQGKRIQMGAKFSEPKKTIPTAIEKELEKLGMSSLKTGEEGRLEQERFIIEDLAPVMGQATFQFVANKVLANAGVRGIAYDRNGNLSKNGVVAKGYNYIDSVEKLELLYGPKSKNPNPRIVKETKALIESGVLAELSKLKEKLKDITTESKRSKEDVRLIELALADQNRSKIDKNEKNRNDINKGKDLIFDIFKDLYDSSKGKNLPAILSLVYHYNSNSNPFRNLATVEFLEKGLNVKDKQIREEHVLAYSNFVKEFVTSISKSKKEWSEFKEWAKENYYQEAISEEQRLILDQKTISVDRFLGTALDPYSPKAGLHPLQVKLGMQNVDINIRKYNEYFTANPNLLGKRGVTDAVRYNVEVDAKYDRNLTVVSEQGRLIYLQILTKAGVLKGSEAVDAKKARQLMDQYLKLANGQTKAAKQINNERLPSIIKYDREISVQEGVNALEKTDKALANGRKLNAPVKKIRVLDFDETVGVTKSNVLYTMPDGKTGKIDPATFAKKAGEMEAKGAEWDFSEFSKVMEGKKGPLFEVMKTIFDKRGGKDLFILTARPSDAAGPIKEFLESLGVNIPIENITGLGDGTPQAKAGWIVGKAAEGYNDFYFADDHIGNVKAVKEVLSQLDVKSKVQQAKFSKAKTFDTIVNDMIKDSAGIETYKEYSAARAKTLGANKGKFNFLIPASAEDFTGLLYKMLGKGKKGDAQMAFLKTNLLDTYDRAESSVTQAKIAAANDFKALKTNLKTLPTSLSKPTGVGGFTFSHAVRTAIWTAQGMEVPGLSKRDVKELNDFVNNNAELKVFTNELIKIQKGKPYPKPGKDWLGGNITSDIINDINKVNRAEYQQEWRENVDIIFSETNMNKMEAAYGTRWRNAMEDSLRRMKSGSNRPPGGNRATDGILDWLNNSVGAVMFLNTRSALLQTISAVNFINWGDNNIAKAGAAFANQKQYWKDYMTLMNSDYLVERRNGLKINVSESELADAVRDSGNKPKAAIAFLLSKGFVMTRFADSFAIASGGSTFYRNRIKALVAKGMEQKAAEAQAFEDFRQIAEDSQQSSNPNKISMQQASPAGRPILAWANTPMQYARIQKRAAQDLINGRGDWKTNVSKIVYYGAVQNLIFNSLQQAVFALGFGEDDEDEDAKKNEKISRVANGMIDSQLKGLGIGGAAVLALKSTLMELGKQHAKKRPEYDEAVFDLLNFSPPLGSKVQKIRGGLRSFSWNKKEMKEKGFSLDNPAYLAGAQITTGLTNVPLDRVAKKINNVRGLVNEQSALWQKVALGLGWSTWDVGLGYYGGFDAAKVLTPEEEKAKEIDDMKKLTKTKEQVDMLLDLGLSKKEIKALGKEQNRVEKIIELQNAEAEPKKEAEVKEEIKEETKPTPVAKPKPTPKPKVKTVSAEARLRRQFDSIKDENKPDQVKTLLKFGLSKKEIRALRYEKNRVEKILELMKK